MCNCMASLNYFSTTLSLFLWGHLSVCPPPRQLITSGVMWHDMDLLSKARATAFIIDTIPLR